MASNPSEQFAREMTRNPVLHSALTVAPHMAPHIGMPARSIHKDGKGQLIARPDAEHYMHLAGGNPQVARAMATHDNHRF